MMTFWVPITSVIFWEVDANNATLTVLISTIHILAWMFIYGGALLLDFPELVGVKQASFVFTKSENLFYLISKLMT